VITEEGWKTQDVIQGIVVAMNCATTEAELISAVFPHPTI
jgi:dihydrolipoamide dehydrogenase